jgi:uncharacterized membrane protein
LNFGLRQAMPMVSLQRLEAFSDAILAIAATVLVTPLVRFDEAVKLSIYLRGATLRETLASRDNAESLALFAGSFAIVFLLFLRHGRQYARLEYQVGVAIVLVNSLELLAATLLPFTSSSAARSSLQPDEDRRYLALPFCANVFLLSVTRVVFEALVIKPHAPLHMIEAGVEMVAYLVALGAIVSAHSVGEMLVWPFLAIPMCTATARLVMSRTARAAAPKPPRGRIERIQGFVDGVFAVVSTLSIVDIQSAPDCRALRDVQSCLLHFERGCRLRVRPAAGGASALPREHECYLDRFESQSRDAALLGTYAMSFCLLGILWHMHSLVLQLHEDAPDSVVLNVGNFAFLCAIALIPYSFTLVATFAVKPVAHLVDPRTFPLPDLHSPDPHAARTACLFALCLLLAASTVIVVLVCGAPKQSQPEAPPRRLLIGVELVLPAACLVNMAWLAGERASHVYLYPLVPVPVLYLVVHHFAQKRFEAAEGIPDEGRASSSLDSPLTWGTAPSARGEAEYRALE